MARSSSPRPNDNDCLRLPATSSPRIRGAEKKESTGLRLNQPCPPYVTPSSISSFDRRLSSVHIAETKSLKNSGANTFCQSSASKRGSEYRNFSKSSRQMRPFFAPGSVPLLRDLPRKRPVKHWNGWRQSRNDSHELGLARRALRFHAASPAHRHARCCAACSERIG